jgi:DNA-binding CsgD family transcriptional regulator
MAIALELGISVTTVRTYLTRLYRDNGFGNRTEAVAAWLKSMALSDFVQVD